MLFAHASILSKLAVTRPPPTFRTASKKAGRPPVLLNKRRLPVFFSRRTPSLLQLPFIAAAILELSAKSKRELV